MHALGLVFAAWLAAASGLAEAPAAQPLRSVAFSPDGKLLAVGGTSEARLYDTATRAELRRLEGSSGAVEVTFLPDGRLVTTGWSDVFGVVYEVTREAPGARAAGYVACASLPRVAWACRPGGDGRRATYVSGLSPRRVRVERWDGAAFGPPVTFDDPGDGAALAVTPDGRVAVTGGFGRSLTETNEELVHRDVPQPDGTIARGYFPERVPAIWRAYVRVWSARGALRCEAALDSEGRSVAFAPTGRDALLVGEKSGAVVLLEGCRRPRLLGRHEAPVTGVAAAPDGRLAASVDEAGGLRWWELRDGG